MVGSPYGKRFLPGSALWFHPTVPPPSAPSPSPHLRLHSEGLLREPGSHEAAVWARVLPRFARAAVDGASQRSRKTSAASAKASHAANGAAVKASGEADVARETCASAGDSKAGKAKCKKAGARASKASKSAKKSSDTAAEKWRKTGAAKAKAGDLAGSKAAYVDGERGTRGRGE